jgi:small GTP-binding protein
LTPVQPENPHLLKVALLGTPNAGKSTLLNRIMGEKVSISSPCKHTTRSRLVINLTHENRQVVFLDAPGAIKFSSSGGGGGKQRDLAMVPWRALQDADYAMVVLDASEHELDPDSGAVTPSSDAHWILKKLRTLRYPSILVLNKVRFCDRHGSDLQTDRVEDKSKVLRLSEECNDIYRQFEYTFMTSAKDKTGVDDIRRTLLQEAKPKEWLYHSDQRVFASEPSRACDVVREKLMRFGAFNSIPFWMPYKCRFDALGWTEMPDKSVRIDIRITSKSQEIHVCSFDVGAFIVICRVRCLAKTASS